VRYDAANDRLELDNVRIGGGHMELFGNIFSTGNGELRVLDGYGRIDIGNETAYDIALGRVDTGQGVEGKIRITDTAKRVIGVGQVDATGARTDGKPLVTEITRLGNQIQIRDSRTVDADGKPTYVAGTATGDGTTYDPAANRRFNWINGRTTTFQETRTHVSRSVFSIDELVPDYDSFTPGTVTAQTPVQRLSGDWLSSGENNVATPGYKMNFTQATTAPEFKEPMRVSVYCPIGCAIYKEATFSADYEWKVSEYFHHSLNASKEIKVNFVG